MSNLEPRIEQIEISMSELRLSISELRSSIGTLADLVAIGQDEIAELKRLSEASITQASQDRATLYQTFEEIRRVMDQQFAEMREQARQDRERVDQDRARTDQRLAEAAERANQDRALMLELIQAMQRRDG